MTNQALTNEEKAWPSVELAYGFVLPSYQMMASRYEAADGRLTSLASMAMALAGFAPVVGRALNERIVFGRWFAIGTACMIAAVALSLFARLRGGVSLPNPNRIFDKHLGKSPWQFRKDAIAHAGDAFDLNAKAIRQKGNYGVLVTILMVLGILAYSGWLAR